VCSSDLCEGVIDAARGLCVTAYQYPGWGPNMPVRDRLASFLPPGITVYVDTLWRHWAHTEVFLDQSGEKGLRERFFLIGNSGDFVSGGMVIGGNAYRGASGIAGEVGHMIVDPRSTERCHCGGRGCLEVLTVPAKVVERGRARFAEYPDSLIFGGSRTGEIDSFCDIGEAADKGDVLAQILMDEVVEYFAIALNNIMVTCDPGKVLFFGDYARCGEYFIQMLRQRSGMHAMRGVDKRTSIDATLLEEESGVIGAANHVADRLFEE
jgi:glucokinase